MNAGAPQRPLDIVILGLSLSSAWGNGHATTFRALIRGLAAEGHRVLFLERDVPWYAPHRDLPDPDFCDFALYDGIEPMLARFGDRLRQADAVIVGSYVPEGIALIDRLDAMGLRQLCFYDIDTPVTLQALDEGRCDYLAPRQIPRFDICFSFSGGAVLTHLQDMRGARRAEALFCSVDETRYPHLPEVPKRWDLGYLGTYSPDRQPTLQALLLDPARRLPEMRFVVAGPQYPADIDWPANVERIEHLPPDEHAGFYNAQRFTLNVTRQAMRRMGWSPSVRLFEAGACGVPVISDDWPGLDELFADGRSILIARDTEDVVRGLAAADAGDARRIGQAARQTVLSGHTGRARARELAAALQAAPAPLSPADGR
ncbi:CgeB family protein [Frigidibacter oleivorans]|uniref:CgeB family protein n=1 Tax=Frigidibacter oleivorans TaxID=2487129 RepID=UPI000F8C970A|nr:glycosyltransferase [Frigidibacter oleivorans]